MRGFLAAFAVAFFLGPVGVAQAITFENIDTNFPLSTGRSTALPTLYQCAGGNLTQILRNTAGARDIGIKDDDDDEDEDGGSFTQSFLAGFGVPCPEVGDFDKKVSCDEVLVGGKLDADRVKDARGRARQAYNAMNCKQRRLASVEAELNSCVKPQLSAITQAMEGLQNNYDREMEQSKKQINQLKSWESDRQAQEDELRGILEGTSTGPGLVQMKQRHLEMINQLSQDKLTIKNAWAQVTIERNKMTEFRSIREASLMADCFNSRVVSSEHKCSPGEPATTPRAVLLCRYQQNSRVGSNGQISEDGVSKQQAIVQAQTLEQLMQKIFGDIPDKGRLPTSAQEGPDFVNQSVNVLSPDEVDRKYGSQLKGLNANGIDVYAFTMANLRACYARGQSTVLREMARDNTQLGQMKLGIQRIERETQSVIERALTKFQDHYGDVLRSLRSNGGLNVDACRVQREDVQNACFEDIKTKYDALLTGPLDMPAIQIRSGSPPARPEDPPTGSPTALSAITGTPGGQIECKGADSGLSNCISKIEKIRGVVQRDISSLKQKKTETVDKTNANIKKSFTTLASQFSRLTRSATDTLEKLKGALASLGVKGVRINSTPMATANLAPNADGLLEVPDGANAMQVVNSFMDPKLPDLSGGMFDGVLDAVGAENKSLATQKRDAYAAYSRINQEALACQKGKVETLASKADRDISEFKSKCEFEKSMCEPPTEIDKLKDDLASIKVFGDDVTGNLQSGLSGLCTERGKISEQLRILASRDFKTDADRAAEKAELDAAQDEATRATIRSRIALEDATSRKTAQTEITTLQIKLAGQTSGVDCGAIVRRIKGSVKDLQNMDKTARDLAGQAK